LTQFFTSYFIKKQTNKQKNSNSDVNCYATATNTSYIETKSKAKKKKKDIALSVLEKSIEIAKNG